MVITNVICKCVHQDAWHGQICEKQTDGTRRRTLRADPDVERVVLKRTDNAEATIAYFHELARSSPAQSGRAFATNCTRKAS